MSEEVNKADEPSLEVKRLETIQAAGMKVNRLRREWEALKGETGAAKKNLEVAVEQLLETIRHPDGPKLELVGEGAEWRDDPITVLDLPKKAHDALALTAELATIGELSDYLASNALTGIDGIGEGAARKIEDAMAKFWADHPEYCQPVPEPDAEAGE